MNSRAHHFGSVHDEINPFSIDFPPPQLSREHITVTPLAPPISQISDLYTQVPASVLSQPHTDSTKQTKEESTSDSDSDSEEDELIETDVKKIRSSQTETPLPESQLSKSQQLFFSRANRNKRLIDVVNDLNKQLEIKEQEISFWKDLSRALPAKNCIGLTSLKKEEETNDEKAEAKEEVLVANYITVQHIVDSFFQYKAIQKRQLEEAELPPQDHSFCR